MKVKFLLTTLAFCLFVSPFIHAKSNSTSFVLDTTQTDSTEIIRTVVTKFFAALEKDNFTEAKKYTVKESDAFFEMMEYFAKDPATKRGKAPIIQEITITKDRALVTFTAQPPMRLEWIDGEWKIDVRMKPLPKN